MFWERYLSLCMEYGLSPTGVEMRQVLGMESTGSISKWKNGVVPSAKRLRTIANYFNTTIDFLLGNSDERIAFSEKNSPLGQSEALRTQEKLKEPPAPEGAGDGAEALADQLYDMLVEIGWVKRGEKTTVQQREIIFATVQLLKAQFQGGEE